MQSEPETAAPVPFVQTSVADWMESRLSITHEERAISVIAGPWGVGKTMAIDAWRREHECECVVVKVEPGSTKTGATPVAILQQTITAIREAHELPAWGRGYLSSSRLELRRVMEDLMERIVDPDNPGQRYTIIYDEAQHISRAAVELLRYWNDRDRNVMPIPIGLVFVGNQELSLAESQAGGSVISGAVHSRALFIEALQYDNVSDDDLEALCLSRGVSDAGAIAGIKAYFSQPRAKRDLRRFDRQLAAIKGRACGMPVTAAIVRAILSPE